MDSNHSWRVLRLHCLFPTSLSDIILWYNTNLNPDEHGVAIQAVTNLSPHILRTVPAPSLTYVEWPWEITRLNWKNVRATKLWVNEASSQERTKAAVTTHPLDHFFHGV